MHKTGLKLVLGLFVYGFTLAVILAAGSFWWVSTEFTKPGPLQQTALFEVVPGDGLNAIAYKLEAQNIISSRYVFILGTRALDKAGRLQAGEYEFTPQITAREVMTKIHDGDVVERRFTIPEGLTSFEIDTIISKIKDIEKTRTDIPAEGALLPGTYNYKLTETNADVLTRMELAMTQTIDELWETRAGNLPFKTKQEALTLASIVEKETGVAEERKRVAGVFINRLRQNIALQTDPTVIYALTKGQPKNEGKGPLGRRLLSKDLEIDSPYNTYKYPGLPPGPIANPGRASIEAVLQPEEHNFIYFVADGSGGHIFAATLDEHNKNVAEWRKIRKSQN